MKVAVAILVIINGLIWLGISISSLSYHLTGTLLPPPQNSISFIVFGFIMVIMNIVILYYVAKRTGERRIEKKPIGVFFIGIITILLDLGVLSIINVVYSRGVIFFGKFNILFFLETVIWLIFTGFLAVRLFSFKEYARKGMVIFMWIGLFFDVIRVLIMSPQISKYYNPVESLKFQQNQLFSIIFALATYLWIIYYLSRPKVKEQFK